KGRALVNLLELHEGESVTGMIPVRDFSEDSYLLMATAMGKVKKTALNAFGKRRSGGIIAVDLAAGDRLIGVRKTTGEQQVVLGSRAGRAIRFEESDVRPMGRGASGVRGIRLRGKDRVVDMAVVRDDSTLLTVCENGYGKRTEFAEYPVHRRGGQGVIDVQTTRRNGRVVAMREVADEQELILITQKGMTVRIPVDSISCIGRNTAGVKLISTRRGDRVSGVAAVAPDDDGEETREAEGQED
ncbi:MAG: DNA gyrase C-terminal beta-propeller domain-containing protein, partial [Planctomycetota bacterium]